MTSRRSQIVRGLAGAIALVALVSISVRAAAHPAVPQDSSDPLKDASRWLASRFLEDPAKTAELAQRLAGSSDRRARDVLVQWIHYTLAREFLPSPGPNAERARLMLDALNEGPDPERLIGDITAGLRLWLEASNTDDAQVLLRLAHTLYSPPETYGGRYLLFLANVLDARKEPELKAASRRIRERLLAEISNKLQGLDRPEFDQPYGVIHYWYGFAASREAELLKREARTAKEPRLRLDLNGKAFMHISNAADLNTNGVRQVPTAWFDEASLMQGGTEFLTPAARALEERAAEHHDAGSVSLAAQAIAAALRRYVQATLVDGATLLALQEASSRLQPGRKWDDLWAGESLRFAARFPFDRFKSDGSLNATKDSSHTRWRVFFLWDPACESCEPAFKTIEALTKDFPQFVSIATSAGNLTELSEYFVNQSLPAPAVVVGDSDLNLVPNVPYLVAPDGRYVRLPPANWNELARAFLLLPGGSGQRRLER